MLERKDIQQEHLVPSGDELHQQLRILPPPSHISEQAVDPTLSHAGQHVPTDPCIKLPAGGNLHYGATVKPPDQIRLSHCS